MTVDVAPDTVATLRTILLARATGTDLEGVAIRPNQPEEGDVPPYVVLAEGGDLHARGVGALLPARVALSVTAETDGEAAALWRLASALLHRYGPAAVVVDGVRVGVWRVHDETGLQRPVQEPDTLWWRASGVFDLTMADRPIVLA